jgi:hypothetical protein
MKKQEIYNKVELLLNAIGFTELYEEQNTIDTPPINQYQIKNFKQTPSISYDDYKFDLVLNFESNEQMYQLFDEMYQYSIRFCFEIVEIAYDDDNNKITLKVQIIW